MRVDKLILAVLLVIIVIKFFAAFPLDNTSIPGGTDVAHFFTNTWYVSTYGLTKWNYFWYGGFPFLRYYPPLAFLITGLIAKVIGALLAYKLVNNLFVILIPLAFYSFLHEFKLSREKEIVALITFSFIPIFAYFLADGRFPTLINVFIALLYWKFLKRSLDSKKFYNISIAAVLLNLSLITHHTTTFLFILISSAWAFIYRTNFETIKKLLAIGILTLALTAWWSLPFFLETVSTERSGLYLRAVGEVYVGDIIYRIKTSVLESPFYASYIEPYLLVIVASLIALFSLLAITKYFPRSSSLLSFDLWKVWKTIDKTTLDFVILSIFIAIMLFVVRYQRSVIFLSIPVAFIVAEGLSLLKKNLRVFASGLFILILVASYLLIRPQVFDMPEYPNIPKDGRVIFFPIGSAYVTSSNQMKNFYSVILSPMNGQENIRGWHDESQLVGKSAAKKFNYLMNVSDPLHTDKEEYYKLLREGYINYVVVNRNDTEEMNYFNDTIFKQIFSDSMFVAYQLNPKTTYVEFNGMNVQSDVNKTVDKIEIDTDCQKGTVLVKESYHQNWQALVNGKKTDVSFDDYGFIKLMSDFEGRCKIVLEFENPQYYQLFYIISIASVVFILFNILKKF